MSQKRLKKLEDQLSKEIESLNFNENEIKIISNYDIVFQCAAFTSGVEDMSKNPFLFIS